MHDDINTTQRASTHWWRRVKGLALGLGWASSGTRLNLVQDSFLSSGSFVRYVEYELHFARGYLFYFDSFLYFWILGVASWKILWGLTWTVFPIKAKGKVRS